MEQAYWLSRMRASLKLARAPATKDRLIYFDLAGRHSVRAAEAEALPFNTIDTRPANGVVNCPDP